MIISFCKIGEEARRDFEKQTGEPIYVFDPESKEAQNMFADADIVVSTNRIDEATMEKCKSVKMLFILSAGVETLPFEALKKRNILVANARGLHAPQMSEQAMGTIITFSRSLHRSIHNQQKHFWEAGQPVGTVAGKTLCVIGVGHIGKVVGEKAAAFGMNVIGLKKHVAGVPGFQKIYGMNQLHEALGESDYVILLTPLTPETYHLMGEEEFAAMKNDAVFINYSRGDTVDEDALISALKNHEIAGAALDVCHQEPLDSASPLWDMENVILTPHTAGFVPNYVDRAMSVVIPNVMAFRQGRKLPTQVNLEEQY